jgi:hypothetical protein
MSGRSHAGSKSNLDGSGRIMHTTEKDPSPIRIGTQGFQAIYLHLVKILWQILGLRRLIQRGRGYQGDLTESSTHPKPQRTSIDPVTPENQDMAGNASEGGWIQREGKQEGEETTQLGSNDRGRTLMSGRLKFTRIADQHQKRQLRRMMCWKSIYMKRR